ncbi:CTP synthase [Candidatus Nesciobacter abundans]|uniref:CTP synthase (glutamine hydrolyzing) n=1 Tax=Candidatus Nesciobacter abundans TaxID=2601668 RepID=A0A5C0UH28_9PROT|nr:CTP synthase [Candidatus Nesciobacter abundans]QEK38853.1 CTP synthase [Candidatus Nesciobacter abundans]
MTELNKNNKKNQSKVSTIFITGGVMSSLGKGITASSIALLLKSRGYNVCLRKLEPYLNVDAGTLSPEQHGEVFVTEDGTETDMDIGNYERFANVKCNKHDYITSGRIFSEVITAERRGDYLGKTVQIIPHITEKISEIINSNIPEGTDFLICEIGGTVGDIEGLPFLEAIKKQAGLQNQKGQKNDRNSLFIHLALMPYIESANELKTKPVQHSVRELQRSGIQPDMIICRSERNTNSDWKKKISMFANVDESNIFGAWTQKSLYEVVNQYHEDGLDAQICDFFQKNQNASSIGEILEVVRKEPIREKELKIAIITKYQNIKDSYFSVTEAVKHAALFHRTKFTLEAIDTSEVSNYSGLKDFDACIVPGGFGARGTKEKISALKFARENNIPCLGICLGMQLMIVEALQNICNIDTNSSEFVKSKNPAVGLIDEWTESQKGGTMRLGSYPCTLTGVLKDIYDQGLISERHRHRYEVNHSFYKKNLEAIFELGAWSPDKSLLEGVAIKEHPFFVGVQFHPEFQSSMTNPHPLFRKLVEAGLKRSDSNK